MDRTTGQGRGDGAVRPARRSGGGLNAWPLVALALMLCGLCAAKELPSYAARRLMQAGRFAEALETSRASLAAADCDGTEAADLLATAVRCLQRLNRLEEYAPLVRSELSRRPSDWLFLAEAHRQVQTEPQGRDFWLRRLAAGVAPVSAGALPPEQQTLFWDGLMTALMRGRDSLWTFWRLQVLTDLTADAEALEGHTAQRRATDGSWADRASGLPLSASGGALFFTSPQSWDKAANDGERYAWCLARLLALLPPDGKPAPPTLRSALRRHAEVCRRVYGEQAAPHGLRRRESDAGQDWSDTLFSLRDNEALVSLATGKPLRTELPREWSPLWLYDRLSDWAELARIHEGRGQYERAAERWRQALKEGDQNQQAEARSSLERLEGNWCLLAASKPGGVHLAGQPVRLRLHYRNAFSASLTAHQVDYGRMVEELARRLESGQSWTDPLQWLQDVQSRGRFLRRQVAAWQERLHPLPGHRDTTTLLTAPLREPGTYLVTCTLDGGRACSTLVVVSDRLLLLAQDGHHGQSLQLLDAANGQPVDAAEVDFLELLPPSRDGQKRQGQRLRRERLRTDRDGLLRLPDPRPQGQPVRSRRFLALVMAANGDWLPAMDRHVWPRPSRPQPDQQPLRGYAMFDRAIYRPAQDIQAQVWLEQGEKALPQGTRLRLTLHAPNGGEALRQELVADASGGVSLTYRLPPEARLGWYAVEVSDLDGAHRLHVGGFRVEAYRKPDFEVTLDLPDEPPKLGEQVEAIVRAAYYFGAPVVGGQLRLTVTRHLLDHAWRWPGPWDWLYARPGAFMPFAPKVAMRFLHTEETVLRTSGTLGADGTFRVTLDTAEALKLHGNDQNHVYDFQVEVEDAGRRVIRARQSLTLSPRPFQAWVFPDSGFALVGEPVRVRLQARTAQGKPVSGSGTLRLFRRTVQPDGTIAETHERSWETSPDAAGRASQTLSASRPGSYRLEWRVTARGETVSGDARLHVFGEGYDGRDFQCQGLEVVADRREYAVGDTARLLVTAEQSGSAVMMLRSGSDGQRRPVQVLRLPGRAQMVEVPLTQDDVPETQCRFYLVREGVLHETLVSLAVPPVASRLQVDAQAEPSETVPGGDCRLRLRVTDSQGRPAASTHLVVTVYDRSLEALAGVGNDRLQRLFQLIGLRFGAPTPTVERLDASAHWLTQGFYARGQEPMVPLHTAAGGFMDAENGVMVGGAMLSAVVSDAAIPKMALAAARGARAAQGGVPEDTAALRTAFADTAMWCGDAVTDHDGQLTLPFRLPDNVTSWRVHVWAKDGHRRVGVGETTLQTAKPLIVRPLAPRFLVESDEAMLGATVHNGLDHEVATQVTLALPEALLVLESGTAARAVRIPAGGSARIEWRVRVRASGLARWSVTATTEEGSDGVEQTLPVRVYGAERQESVCGVLREGQPMVEVPFEVPERRRPETMRLEVTWTPSLAQSLLAAMPYLLAEPEGCTERTVSRLTSLLRVRQTLTRLKLPLQDIAAARPSSSSPAWRRTAAMAVFDDDELSRMVSRGLAALAALQCADGGWGWYPGLGERSDALMTALAVEGLLTARAHGISVEPMLKRGLDCLERLQRDTLDNLKRQRAASHSLELDVRLHQVLCLAGRGISKMSERLWRHRAELSPYGLALFALAEQTAGRRERQDELTTLLRQYVREDAESGMAWVDCGAFPHWLWQGDRIETQAACLKLLLAQPQLDLRLASALVAHLLAHRRHATYWYSTRDTAACLDAIADYLLASGELAPDAHVELLLDGQKVAESRLDATRLWTQPLSFVLQGVALTAGRHVLTLRRQGRGNLYYTSRLAGFSQEADLLPAGLEAKVSRAVFRLEQTLGKATFLPDREGHPVPVITPETRRLPLRDGDTVSPGDLLEVQLTLDAKFDLEYLQLDDPRIAGAEPLDALSGHVWQGLFAYRETRDDATRFYLQRLPQGRHQLSYQLRVETPGRFCALPSQLKAVYAPDIRGNSDAIRLRVTD